MRSPGESRAGFVWLAIAIAVYVALRAAMLSVAFDGTALPVYELYPMGTIPKLVPEGDSLPLRDYYDNAAGQLLTGILAVPYYALFGPSYLALKLVPATLGLVALVVAFFFARSIFGVRAAAATALAFALGTTTSLKYSLIASGNHFENVFFSTLSLATFFAAHRKGATRTGLALAAFTAGFSIFVFLGALIPVALLASVHLGLRGPQRTLRDLAVLAPAFALGILPLLFLNLGHDSRGVEFLDKRFGVEQAVASSGFVERFLQFFVIHLANAPCFESWLGVAGGIADEVFRAATAIVWIALLPRAWRGARKLFAGARSPNGVGALETADWIEIALVPLIAYLPLCALAFAVSDLRVGGFLWPIEAAGYRYFLLHFAWVTLLAGAWFSSWTASGASPGKRASGWLVLAAILLCGAFDLGALSIDATPREAWTAYEGYDYAYLPRGLLGRKNAHSKEDVIARIERVPSEHRARVYWGVGFYAGLEQSRGGRADLSAFDLARAVDGWPQRYQSDVARGFGTFLRPRKPNGANSRDVALLVAGWIAAKAPFAENVAEGIGIPWEFPLATESTHWLDESAKLLAAFDASTRPALARGLGMFVGRLVARGIGSDLAAARKTFFELDDSLRREAAFGLGFASVDDRELLVYSTAIEHLGGAVEIAAARRGFVEGLRHLHGDAELAELLPRIASELPAEVRASLDAR